MTSSFQVGIMILSTEVGYLLWVWMNSEKIRKRQSFSVILQTSHNQTFIGSWFPENVFYRSKFKTRSHDLFFSWTFDLLLISFNWYLLFGLYFSLHQRNIVCKYKLQRKPIMKLKQEGIHFHLLLILMLKNTFFNAELKFLNNFFSISWTHFLKIIKLPFWKGVNLNRVLKKRSYYYVLIIFFLSASLMCKKSNSFVYIFVVNCQFFQITPTRCAL